MPERASESGLPEIRPGRTALPFRHAHGLGVRDVNAHTPTGQDIACHGLIPPSFGCSQCRDRLLPLTLFKGLRRHRRSGFRRFPPKPGLTGGGEPPNGGEVSESPESFPKSVRVPHRTAATDPAAIREGPRDPGRDSGPSAPSRVRDCTAPKTVTWRQVAFCDALHGDSPPDPAESAHQRRHDAGHDRMDNLRARDREDPDALHDPCQVYPHWRGGRAEPGGGDGRPAAPLKLTTTHGEGARQRAPFFAGRERGPRRGPSFADQARVYTARFLPAA